MFFFPFLLNSFQKFYKYEIHILLKTKTLYDFNIHIYLNIIIYHEQPDNKKTTLCYVTLPYFLYSDVSVGMLCHDDNKQAMLMLWSIFNSTLKSHIKSRVVERLLCLI